MGRRIWLRIITERKKPQIIQGRRRRTSAKREEERKERKPLRRIGEL